MTSRYVLGGCFIAAAAILLYAGSLGAQHDQHKVRIIQTNSAGDNVHLIDPATNKVVGVINGIEVNHGAGGAPPAEALLGHQRSREHGSNVACGSSRSKSRQVAAYKTWR